MQLAWDEWFPTQPQQLGCRKVNATWLLACMGHDIVGVGHTGLLGSLIAYRSGIRRRPTKKLSPDTSPYGTQRYPIRYYTSLPFLEESFYTLNADHR